jgi:predicted NBD/HSP70 family sugar kinase/biotin operon repressor
VAYASQTGRNALTVRAHNRRLLLLRLLRRQPISRVRLSREVGLSTTTVTNLVSDLMDSGYVEEVGTDIEALTSGAGRPPLALSLVPESAYSLGLHVGVRWMRVALCDLGMEVLDSAVLDVDRSQDASGNLLRAADAAMALAKKHGVHYEPQAGPGFAVEHDHHESAVLGQTGGPRLIGMGVGASGLVDVHAGVNLIAPNLRWYDVPIPQLLSQHCGLPVAVDNNVRCMALSESMYGVGQEARAIAFVYARIGVGAGLVVDGRLYHGAGYGAGEIGHWVVSGPYGNDENEPVTLEDLISEREIVKRAQVLDPALLTGVARPIQTIFQATREGHEPFRHLLDEVAYFTGVALANLVDVLNPELILLGGLLEEGYDLLQAPIANTMRRFAFAGLGKQVEIRSATFGSASGEIGAAVLAFDEFFYGRRPMVNGRAQ